MSIYSRTSRHVPYKRKQKVRQRGYQECESVEMYKSITKWSVRIEEAKKIRYTIEKAINIAKRGKARPSVRRSTV